jgi:hypothetical protein
MQNLGHVFPGQVRHIFIVLSVLESSWRLLSAGISFLSTQLVSNFKLSIHEENFFPIILCPFVQQVV